MYQPGIPLEVLCVGDLVEILVVLDILLVHRHQSSFVVRLLLQSLGLGDWTAGATGLEDNGVVDHHALLEQAFPHVHPGLLPHEVGVVRQAEELQAIFLLRFEDYL